MNQQQIMNNKTCTCITNSSFIKCQNQLKNIKFAELRLDLMKLSVNEFKQLLNLDKKYIITCRDGVFDNKQRLEFFRIAVETKSVIIDLEIEAGATFIDEVKNLCKNNNSKLMISYHNFKQTPKTDQLKQIINECIGLGADLVKIACMVNNEIDNSRILGIYQYHKNIIAFGMGKLGVISRIASLYCGAAFTYTAINNNEKAAPGQLTNIQLNKLIKSINQADNYKEEIINL